MIDITKSQPKITKIRYTCLKEFDIDVTIGEETHNLSLTILSEEDKQGQDTELIEIRIATQTFRVSVGHDVGSELHGSLDSWFGDTFDGLSVEETKEDFDAIFSDVWGYIEEKDLY